MGSQPARKCWDGLALNRKDQGQTRKARFVSCVSALQLSRITSRPELFQGEKEPNRPLLLLDQLRCFLTRACPGFLAQPHSTTEQDSQLRVLREPPAIPGNPAHGRLQKRMRGCSQAQGGLQLTPRSAQTLVAGLSSLKGLTWSARGAGCASTATPACH